MPGVPVPSCQRTVGVLPVYCSVLQHVAVCCSVLQYVAVRCNMVQSVAACCSMLQHDAACCSMLQCVAVGKERPCLHTNTPMYCSVLHHVAVCCSRLQCIAVRPSHKRVPLPSWVLPTCCSALQSETSALTCMLTHNSNFTP